MYDCFFFSDAESSDIIVQASDIELFTDHLDERFQIGSCFFIFASINLLIKYINST